MELFSTRAIVLRVRSAAVADFLVTMLTPRHGRLVCAARNARRSFRRFSGCLNLFSEMDAVVAAHEGRDIARLESAALVEAFEGLRSDLPVLAAASAGVELVDRISRGAEESPAVYDETRRLLCALSTPGADRAGTGRARVPPKDLLTVFSLRVLALAGFRPEFDHCVSCGRDATARNVKRTFDVHRGGLLCPKCAGTDSTHRRDLVSLSAPARAALKEMLVAGLQPEAQIPNPSFGHPLPHNRRVPCSPSPDAGEGLGVRGGEGRGEVFRLKPLFAAECSRLVESLIVERLGSPLRSWSFL